MKHRYLVMENTTVDKGKKNKQRHNWLKIGIAGAVVSGAAVILTRIANATKEPESIDDDNPYLGVNSDDDGAINTASLHRNAVQHTPTAYEKFGKQAIDKTLSLCGLILLAPVYAAIAIAIKIDDPGPVFFKQKRVGKDKRFFELHKFRSMKMSTPHDVPTHELSNPDSYITSVGRFLRKTSLDELPQIWDIFRGKMSIIGPRPALWNQADLVAERDKYGANDVMPGLTGYAQINGRDELEIPVKAALDGEYVKSLERGDIDALKMDAKCFIGTIKSVLNAEGVVEGGTGELKKDLRQGVPENDPESSFGCDMELQIDSGKNKKVLITGAGSYIGESFRSYAKEHYPHITVDTLDMQDSSWRSFDFSSYDSVFHVAGIAHADVGNVTDEIKEKYYQVNTDLAIETANHAKLANVKQFIMMSSMIIYGDSANPGKKKIVTRDTLPNPSSFYGDSKWQADRGVRALADDSFKVAVLRPPMIYGKGSKGNYPTLEKMARKLPFFPDADNERSMLYIDNLCEFVAKLILSSEGGVYFPQNAEYSKTSALVKSISNYAGGRIAILPVLKPFVNIASHVPGKIGDLANKAFGSLVYDQALSEYSFDYRVYSLEESIREIEEKTRCENNEQRNDSVKKRVWIISHFAGGPSYCPRIPDYSLAKYLREHGYEALVFASSFLHNTDINFITDGSAYKSQEVDGVPFVFIRTREYTGRKGETLGFIDFYQNLMKAYKHYEKPDIIVSVMPQPASCLAAYRIAKKLNVPLITDVVDLWPLSIVEYADFSENNPAIRAMYLYEKWLYEKSDALVFSWEGAYDYIIDQGWSSTVPVDKFNYINIGVDLKDFYSNLEQYVIDDPVLFDDKFRVMYCGSVRTANDIGTVVESAKKLNERGYGDKIQFIIYGDGPDRAVLEEKCEDEGIHNVFFKGNIEKKYIPFVLSRSNLNILNLKPAKTQKYGNSSNKLFEYLAAGNPVIANIDEGKYPIISRYGCGKVVKPNSPEDYADGIEYFYNLSKEELEVYRTNAKNTAQLFDTEEMNAKWEGVIRRLLQR